MKMAKKSTAVAKRNGDRLPVDLATEMEADAGDGFQDVTTQDMAIPFLRILQSMSPQLNKRDGSYVAGAEEGQIFNTVTGELWDADKGVNVVPCAFKAKKIEWRPRDSGGGFVAAHSRDVKIPTEKNDKGKDVMENGNLLVDTTEFYVLILSDNGFAEQAVITMSSTQLKYSRKWITLMAQQLIDTKEGQKRAPFYSSVYNMKTMSESNADGDWSSWDIGLVGHIPDVPTYHTARAFARAVEDGDVEAKHVAPDEGEETTSDVM